MFPEHSSVVLLTDVPGSKLVAGDVGIVVHVYGDGAGYEVEFVRYDESSNGAVTLEAAQLRAAGARDVPHERETAA